MPAAAISMLSGWRKYLFNSTWRYLLRILFALSGCAAVPWILQQIEWTIPLTLGVVAAALADLDDRLAGRLKNLLITLLCFCIASVSVELLFPHPLVFIIGLAGSTWGFILLGALGQRYATIAFGALLIAVYTMLGIGLFSQWYMQPMLLLVGALWYNLLTLLGHLMFPVRPVQEQLAASFSQLAHYLDAKANLFDPDAGEQDDAAFVKAAMVNSQLVAQLNLTKTTLQSRLRGDRGSRGTRRSLHYYFVAQDIHERASSSHLQYHLLRGDWRYNEILFRFQRLLNMQAQACRQLARAILLRERWEHDGRFERVFERLENAIHRLAQSEPDAAHTGALLWLLRNLQAIDAQLASIETEQAQAVDPQHSDNLLSREELSGWSDIKLRLSLHLSPASALFRHAVRMSIVMCVGYGFIQITGLERGYWILLTSLFVCQPNYSATQRRLALRIGGTLAGIALGLPLLWLVPSIEGQLVLIVVTGVMFFAFRQVQYAHATLFITLLVLFCFNLLGEGFEVALPRVVDTLLGCALAWLAVTFIWPDWRFRQLPAVATRTLNANCRYLDAIMEQYHQGKDNRLAYRIARRDAHNADAELASVVSNMSSETRTNPKLRESAFQLLCLNHSLLSYISALGAHRDKVTDPALLALLDDTVCYVEDVLQTDIVSDSRAEEMRRELEQRLTRFTAGSDSPTPLVLQQLGLLVALLPEIARLRRALGSH
ncbi:MULTISPECIES: YccS family putative transporter [Pantoea]|uniref:Putative inner membrane protein n=1 Tax=Pantoea stewartii subsp. stewartii DC283 TaxID=660596 RepID=H3RBF3_PANSE|nr:MULTISPECIES: YccS family putative transporter [Pantoea]ARF49599.1 TIGR01666 family membrane protein [Pantoea stewartii subsp. stewartii DC283]EHU01292.1 putative inner membrane protein [Pantoea stewartii subsp. stewartii DC283]KAB0559961.1 TIGR01666 family membrane protein [Pantoea stewartii subsp. stewartii]KGD85110.1 membrane protein [Pantoea stewartii subsp. indologenes]MDF7784478.1 YccS family putative transporter [Pantoea stewartii]